MNPYSERLFFLNIAKLYWYFHIFVKRHPRIFLYFHASVKNSVTKKVTKIVTKNGPVLVKIVIFRLSRMAERSKGQPGFHKVLGKVFAGSPALFAVIDDFVPSSAKHFRGSSSCPDSCSLWDHTLDSAEDASFKPKV